MLDYVALGLLFFVVITLFYGVIAIHDIPYEIAHRRNHPHQDAIHAAGWVSLLTLHVLWPFLWIWAMAYRPERGWGFAGTRPADNTELQARLDDLERQLTALQQANVPAVLDPGSSQSETQACASEGPVTIVGESGKPDEKASCTETRQT